MSKPIIVAAMTGAELRTMREYLGFSTMWLSRWLDVGERKLIRWEYGELSIPAGVAGQMDDLYEEASAEVDRLIDELQVQVQEGGGSAQLMTYRTDEDYWRMTGQTGAGDDRYPARWHRAICARVADAVPGVELRYAE